MPNTPITAQPFTPEALTAVLRREGVLPQGDVLVVTYRANQAFNSAVVHLDLSYSPRTPSTAPRHLLLKRSLAEPWAIEAGAREVAFYQIVAGLPERLPMIVRCYDAVYDRASGNSHVLLEDVSTTHRVAMSRDQQMRVGENVPAPDIINAVVDALARFHAYWWEHALLGTGIAQIGTWWQDEAHYAHETRRRAAAWADLIEQESDWFPEHIQRSYQGALEELPRLWERYHKPRIATRHNLTLTHDDAYFANFLCPNRGTTGETYLIDWQGPAAGRGVADLVNLCATFWTSSQRNEAQRETTILRRYLDVLHSHGVAHYTWDDLLLDYRIGVIEWLFVPAQDRADGAGKDYWWSKLQCIAAAFEDLNCAELL